MRVEIAGTTLNLELFWCHLPETGECKPERLTNNSAWDEQAIFTPEFWVGCTSSVIAT